MTFDDDFVRLEMDGGTRQICCKIVGFDWPPPEQIRIFGFDFVRESFSGITDKQREGMTHVVRGALYQPVLVDKSQQPGVLLH